MAGAIPLHLVTVEPREAEIRRMAKLAEILHPVSARTVDSLDGMHLDEATDAPTLVRLSGRSHTQVLTWFGAKGRVTTEVAILGFADGIVKELGQPPRAIGVLAQAFVSAVASTKLNYDPMGAAMIIGVTDETRAMAASLSRLGYKRLIIVDTDDQKTEQMVQMLRKRLFGIDIQGIARATLTQVPNETSMAINLIPASETALLEDVSYLNFLKKNGVWIDWTDAITTLGYGEEIANAGAQVFESELIRAWRDIFLLNAVPGAVPAFTGQKPEELADLARQIHEGFKTSSS